MLFYPVFSRRSAIPPEPFYIHTAVGAESHALPLQKGALLRPPRCRTSGMVHHPVARVVAIIGRVTEHPPHQPGVFLPADEPGDLAVGGHPGPPEFPPPRTGSHRSDAHSEFVPSRCSWSAFLLLYHIHAPAERSFFPILKNLPRKACYWYARSPTEGTCRWHVPDRGVPSQEGERSCATPDWPPRLHLKQKQASRCRGKPVIGTPRSPTEGDVPAGTSPTEESLPRRASALRDARLAAAASSKQKQASPLSRKACYWYARSPTEGTCRRHVPDRGVPSQEGERSA